jgi:hypothetical protein
VIVDDGHDLRLVEIGEDHGIIRLEAVDVIDERLALVDVDKLVDELRERSVADRILKETFLIAAIRLHSDRGAAAIGERGAALSADSENAYRTERTARC